MLEKFSDRARKVIALTNKEAQDLNQEYIGTEHLLLGILKEGSGVACCILRSLNVDYCSAKQSIQKIIQPASDVLASIGKLPKTPRLKVALNLACEEAKNLGHHYVGTEHLLLGLLKEGQGVAHQVLTGFGLHLNTIKKEVHEMLSWENPNEPDKTIINNKEELKQFISELKLLLQKQSNLLEKTLEKLNEML